jgi:enolase
MDAASTEMFDEAKKAGKEGGYLFWKSGELKTRDQMIRYWADLAAKYPIISLEDGLAEEDLDGWKELRRELGQDADCGRRPARLQYQALASR